MSFRSLLVALLPAVLFSNFHLEAAPLQISLRHRGPSPGGIVESAADFSLPLPGSEGQAWNAAVPSRAARAAAPAAKQRVFFYMPPHVKEGGKAGKAIIRFAKPEKSSITFLIENFSKGVVTAPSKVTIKSGATSVEFNFTVKDDKIACLNRDATFGISVPEADFELLHGSVVYDDEPAPRLVSVSDPGEAVETPNSYYGHSVKITLDKPAARDGFLSIKANPAGEVEVDSAAYFRKGEKIGYFDFDARDDDKLDGTVKVKFTISAAGKTLAKCTGRILDNESHQIALTLPENILEGGKSTGSVKIGGVLPKPLTVKLTRTGEVIIPQRVVIPAGETSASFNLSLPDNKLSDGMRKVNITAAAGGLLTATKSLALLDNEVAGFRISYLDQISDQIRPVRATVTAVDVGGTTVPDFNGPVNLHGVLAAGGKTPLSPSSVKLVSGVWTGLITFPSSTSLITGLTATGPKGNKVDVKELSSMRILKLAAADLVWDQLRGRIYASVSATASGAYANKIVAIDPQSMQITGSLAINQDPGQMVITSGGEYLYVQLKANGSVAKIDLHDLSLLSTFPMGNHAHGFPMRVNDMCVVDGRPELLVAAWHSGGVAVYENGVPRALKIDNSNCDTIEPSSDPNLFFGYDTRVSSSAFTLIRVGEDGVEKAGTQSDLIGMYVSEFRSSGDHTYSSNGSVVEGTGMKRIGTIPTNGPVCPDSEIGRVFYLEPEPDYQGYYQFISAYDSRTFRRIQRLSLPFSFSSAAGFIRWGSHGLAVSSGEWVMLLNSPGFVASEAPADLVTSLRAKPDPAQVGKTVTYTGTVTNAGPDVARAVNVAADLSGVPLIQGASSSVGQFALTGTNATFDIGDLAVGASVTFQIQAKPSTADNVACVATARSNSIDADFANNTAVKRVNFAFKTGSGVINPLNISANNIIRDPVRNLVWASIPREAGGALAASIVSINPVTGWVSDPIPLDADPLKGSIAISSNGRYLYVGLADVAEISRVDLEAAKPVITRVPLGKNGWGESGKALDIEVLDSDGTSILVVTSGDNSAIVIDDLVRRPLRTMIYTASRVERTATPGLFVGLNSESSGMALTHLLVTEEGVSVTKSVDGIVDKFYSDIRGEGAVLVSTTGALVDSSTLMLKKNLGVEGRPCLELAKNRFFMVTEKPNKPYGVAIRAFNAANGALLENRTVNLPPSATGYGRERPDDLLRWGSDGFAVLGYNGSVCFTRQSFSSPAPEMHPAGSLALTGEDPADADIDGDGIPAALEHLFGTDPSAFTTNPVKLEPSQVDGRSTVNVSFPRRSGIVMPSYGYETSEDLIHWKPVADVSESVVAMGAVNGVEIDQVTATLPSPPSGSGFVRLCWFQP